MSSLVDSAASCLLPSKLTANGVTLKETLPTKSGLRSREMRVRSFETKYNAELGFS